MRWNDEMRNDEIIIISISQSSHHLSTTNNQSKLYQLKKKKKWNYHSNLINIHFWDTATDFYINLDKIDKNERRLIDFMRYDMINMTINLSNK